MKDDQNGQHYKVSKVTPQDGLIPLSEIRPLERDAIKKHAYFHGFATNVTYFIKDIRKSKAFLIFFGVFFSFVCLLMMLSGNFIFGLIVLSVVFALITVEIKKLNQISKETGVKVPQTANEVWKAGEDLLDDFREPMIHSCQSTFTKHNLHRMKKVGIFIYLGCCTLELLVIWFTSGPTLACFVLIIMILVGIAFSLLLKFLVKVFAQK